MRKKPSNLVRKMRCLLYLNEKVLQLCSLIPMFSNDPFIFSEESRPTGLSEQTAHHCTETTGGFGNKTFLLHFT